jgi:protein TonB
MNHSVSSTEDDLGSLVEARPIERARGVEAPSASGELVRLNSEQPVPARGATALGVAFALAVHLGVIALSPREAAQAAVEKAPPVEMEFIEPPPPPPPEPEVPEEPVQAVMAPERRPEPVVRPEPKKAEPPPKAAEDTPPPPAAEPVAEPAAEKPSEPAPALVAAPDANSTNDHTIVQSASGAFAGKGTGGSGVPGGTGTGAAVGSRQGVVGGTGTGTATPVTLSLKDWRCAWPEEAEYEDFDQQLVSIRVVVAEDGRVEKADIVTDPGYGFGRAARDCARRVRFNPAKDASGRAVKAVSPPINVRFVR